MKKYKGKKILYIIFLMILFVYILFFTKDKFGKIDYINDFPIGANYSNIAILDKRIFSLEGNILSIYDNSGKEISSEPISLEKASIVGNYNKAIVYKDKMLYIINKNGKIKNSINTEFNILNIKIEEDIIYVVGEKNLNIYDFKGNEISNIETKEKIATFSLSSDKKKILVTTLFLERNVYVSTLYLKDIKENKKVVLSFPNEIIIFSKFLDKENYILVSNRQILYMYDLNISNKRLVSNIKGVGVIKSNIYLLEGDILNIYNLDFDLINTIDLKGEYKYLYAVNDRLFLLNDNTVSEYIRGEIKNTTVVDNILRRVVNNNGLYILMEDSIIKAGLNIGG